MYMYMYNIVYIIGNAKRLQLVWSGTRTAGITFCIMEHSTRSSIFIAKTFLILKAI